MRSSIILALATLTAACAGGGGGTAAAPAPAPQPAPTAAPAAPGAYTQGTVQRPAAEPEKPKDIDPSGNYNVSLTYGGQPLTIYLQLWKKEDGSGYAGSISAEQVPTIPLGAIAVSGKKLTTSLSSPDGIAVSMEFTIDGSDLSGSWKGSNGDGSQMSGRRAP